MCDKDDSEYMPDFIELSFKLIEFYCKTCTDEEKQTFYELVKDSYDKIQGRNKNDG